MQEMGSTDYVIRVFDDPAALPQAPWDALLARQSAPTPFMRHAYLQALHACGSAVPATGWAPRFLTLWQRGGPDTEMLVAACPLYLKAHSYGEYVFDWAWADAYARHGLAYYPKAVVAVPFTPVPGSRLLATDTAARRALIEALLQHVRAQGASSLHLLFGATDDLADCTAAGLMPRETVQFHWTNRGWRDFDDFLASLSQDKRKKIRQERRKVAEAGVRFRWARGPDIRQADWDFFYRCYTRTYLEHGNAPYLTREFFAQLAAAEPEPWLLFVAEREGRPIASSLIAVHDRFTLGYRHESPESSPTADADPTAVAYGRYWGALERVDCLHFEACYHQPLHWCIAHGIDRFEGGAQGEHKLARALLPVSTRSAHWVAHPGFADAIARFLQREADGVAGYLDELAARSPLRRD